MNAGADGSRGAASHAPPPAPARPGPIPAPRRARAAGATSALAPPSPSSPVRLAGGRLRSSCAGRVPGLVLHVRPFVGCSLVLGVVVARPASWRGGRRVLPPLAALSGVSPATPAAAARRPPRRPAAAWSCSASRRRSSAASVLLFLVFDALGLGYGVLGKLVHARRGRRGCRRRRRPRWSSVARAAARAGHLAAHARLLRHRHGRAHPVVLPRRPRRLGLLPQLGDGDEPERRPGQLPGGGACDRRSRPSQRQRDRFTPAAARAARRRHRADVRRAGHQEGAQLATLAQIRQTSTLPGWAIASLEKAGLRHRHRSAGRGRLRRADIVAWRVGPQRGAVLRPGVVGRSSTEASSRRRCPSTGSSGSARPGVALIVVLGLLGAWILSRSVGAAGAPAGGGERPARRRRSRRHRHAGGPARTAGARGLVQRHERQAGQGAGDRAGVPPLGQPRAQDAAHLHPRLRRGHRRRDGEAGRRRRRDRRRVQPPGAAGRRPARVRADAQGRLHRPPRSRSTWPPWPRTSRAATRPRRATPASRCCSTPRPAAARSPTTTACSRSSPTWSRTRSAARRRRAR